MKHINVKECLNIIKDSHHLIQCHFPYYQYHSAWKDIIGVEAAYLTLIVFVHAMTLHRQNNEWEKKAIDMIVEEWCEFILAISATPNTQNNINIIHHKLMSKQQSYLPLIDNYVKNIIKNKSLENHTEVLIKEDFLIYENFIKFSLENYQDIMSDEYSVLNFHTNKSDNDLFFAIHDSLFNEERNAQLNQHDYYKDLKNNGKTNIDNTSIDERARFICHQIMILLSCCANYRSLIQSSMNNRYQFTNQKQRASINILGGRLNSFQYFVCAIIPCFLILAINDSLFLFPPNLSIPQFAICSRIRDLSTTQTLSMSTSYFLAVINLLYLQIKRLNDVNRNPILCLISFIPFLGACFTISLTIKDFFPRKDETVANDPFISFNHILSSVALLIFLSTWLMART